MCDDQCTCFQAFSARMLSTRHAIDSLKANFEEFIRMHETNDTIANVPRGVAVMWLVSYSFVSIALVCILIFIIGTLSDQVKRARHQASSGVTVLLRCTNLMEKLNQTLDEPSQRSAGGRA